MSDTLSWSFKIVQKQKGRPVLKGGPSFLNRAKNSSRKNKGRPQAAFAIFEPVATDQGLAAEAAEAAESAAEAAAEAAEAAASAAEAAGAGAGVAAGAGAGAGAGASSFLLQAAIATAAAKEAIRSDFFIFVLKAKSGTITEIVGALQSSRVPTRQQGKAPSLSSAQPLIIRSARAIP